jgi:hypothetical protein
MISSKLLDTPDMLGYNAGIQLELSNLEPRIEEAKTLPTDTSESILMDLPGRT